MAAEITQTYRAFAYNNAWANYRILQACLGLSDTDFALTRVSFFPSLQATLNHNYTVDLFYIDALEGGWLGPAAWAADCPFPVAADLASAQTALDARLIAVCASLTADALSASVRLNRGRIVQTERCDRLLMHLFQHQIHHRGQAHAMLAGSTARPPQLDEFFSIDEARLRENDFARLGWTEAMIWRP